MSTTSQWEIIRDASPKTLKSLERKGAKHAEAFFSTTRTIEVTIRNSEVLTENVIEDTGLGIRAATTDDRVGFACTNLVNNGRSVLEIGEKALAIAKLSAPVASLALPAPGKIPRVAGLFSRNVTEAKVEDAVEIAVRMIQSIKAADKRVTAKDGRVAFSCGKRGIVNTLRVDLEEEETRAVAYVGASGSQGSRVTPTCYDIELKRDASLDPERIAEKAAQMVVAEFNPKPAESFEGTVVFSPEAVSYQLFDALEGALNAEKVIAGQSPWKDRTGENVTSENLSVTDNSILEGGFSSRAFDDEGQPSQKTALVSRGKLVSFLHSATTASRLRMGNTGNASRSAGEFELVKQIIGNGYKAKPEVYPSNLTVRPGTKTQEELISEIQKGVLVESMAGFVQPGSGLISAQLSRAHRIEKGEIREPLKGGMVSGIAFDWFKRVCDVGNDCKQFINSVVPSLRIEHVKVIGAR